MPEPELREWINRVRARVDRQRVTWGEKPMYPGLADPDPARAPHHTPAPAEGDATGRTGGWDR